MHHVQAFKPFEPFGAFETFVPFELDPFKLILNNLYQF